MRLGSRFRHRNDSSVKMTAETVIATSSDDYEAFQAAVIADYNAESKPSPTPLKARFDFAGHGACSILRVKCPLCAYSGPVIRRSHITPKSKANTRLFPQCCTQA